MSSWTLGQTASTAAHWSIAARNSTVAPAERLEISRVTGFRAFRFRTMKRLGPGQCKQAGLKFKSAENILQVNCNKFSAPRLLGVSEGLQPLPPSCATRGKGWSLRLVHAGTRRTKLGQTLIACSTKPSDDWAEWN